MKNFKYIITCFFLIYSCKQDLDEVFVNKKVKSLFIEFCDEAANNNAYGEGNNIIISVYDYKSDEAYCISFKNRDNYNSNDIFGSFKYKRFNIYVNQNVPKSMIKLHKYDDTIKSFIKNKNGFSPFKEYLDMWICVQNDTISVKRINFENDKYKNIWQIIK